MNKAEMIIKLKEYCDEQLQMVTRYGGDAKQAITRAYGAMMFFLSVFPDDCEYEGIGWWWDNEMHPKFMELGVY